MAPDVENNQRVVEAPDPFYVTDVLIMVQSANQFFGPAHHQKGPRSGGWGGMHQIHRVTPTPQVVDGILCGIASQALNGVSRRRSVAILAVVVVKG
jgi:hypothetical protein